MHMGTAGRASVESLHALDSYQQSMLVNRLSGHSLEMLSVTCKLGTYSVMLHDNWRLEEGGSETDELDEL